MATCKFCTRILQPPSFAFCPLGRQPKHHQQLNWMEPRRPQRWLLGSLGAFRSGIGHFFAGLGAEESLERSGRCTAASAGYSRDLIRERRFWVGVSAACTLSCSLTPAGLDCPCQSRRLNAPRVSQYAGFPSRGLSAIAGLLVTDVLCQLSRPHFVPSNCQTEVNEAAEVGAFHVDVT